VKLWEDATLKMILERNLEPLPFSLAVAPIELGFEPKDLAKEAKKKHVISRGLGSLREEIVTVLQKTKCFRTVRQLGAEEGKAERGDILDRAWEARDDLVLFLRLLKYENSWEGSNGLFLPNLLLWASFWWPSWWIADEKYGASVEMELSLVSVHSRKVVAQEKIAASEVRDLDDFDRGWQLVGILRVPSSLDEENWEKISDVVSPYPISRVEVDLAKFFHEPFRAIAAGPGFGKKMSKTLALVIGLSRYDSYKLHNVRFAVKDAQGIYDALVGEAPGKVLPQNARLLLDERATGENIRMALDEFINGRARPEDTVIIYYAGYGAQGPYRKGEDAFLVPYDYDHKKGLGDTGLSLSALKDAIERCPAGKVILLFDASFSGETGGRSFTEFDAPRVMDAVSKLVESRTGAAVLFAAAPSERALEFEDRERGLFSFYLVDGLGGKADKDKDGRITAREMTGYVKDKVYEKSLLKGDSQTPGLLENGGADALFPFGESSAKGKKQ
jgi:hypothetical protein